MHYWQGKCNALHDWNLIKTANFFGCLLPSWGLHHFWLIRVHWGRFDVCAQVCHDAQAGKAYIMHWGRQSHSVRSRPSLCHRPTEAPTPWLTIRSWLGALSGLAASSSDGSRDCQSSTAALQEVSISDGPRPTRPSSPLKNLWACPPCTGSLLICIKSKPDLNKRESETFRQNNSKHTEWLATARRERRRGETWTMWSRRWRRGRTGSAAPSWWSSTLSR